MRQRSGDHLSAILVIGLTLIALLAGWLLMIGVTQQTVPVKQSGVVAAVPSGWMIKYGLEGEEMIFWTSDRLDLNHRYTVSLLPAVPKGTLTDVVVNRNFNRSQELSGYQVVRQTPLSRGYRVDFAYIQPGGAGNLPKVIQGVDYFIPTGEKVLVITGEDEESTFSQSLESFERFLETVRYSPGG
jgi:hypothetical protein